MTTERCGLMQVMVSSLVRGLVVTLGLTPTFAAPASSGIASVRDPAAIAAWVEARIPAAWNEALGPVTWHVGELYRAGAAMETDCSGGEGDGPLIGFSTDVFNRKSDAYWRQAFAHEYGHAVLCILFQRDPRSLASWADVAGPVEGAPNHVEMFAQCWAKVITGSAPPGYDYRCGGRGALMATVWVAAVGPPDAPIFSAEDSVPDVEPPVEAP